MTSEFLMQRAAVDPERGRRSTLVAAGAFKGGLRGAIGKDCVVVARKKARVVLEAVVAPENKGAVVHFTMKSPKTDEIVESRDFHSPRPQPSAGLTRQMGRAVAEMARRAPVEE